jgi:hypothetical protein
MEPTHNRPISSNLFSHAPRTHQELFALILLVASIAAAVLGWRYQSDKLGTSAIVFFVLSICFQSFPLRFPFSTSPP